MNILVWCIEIIWWVVLGCLAFYPNLPHIEYLQNFNILMIIMTCFSVIILALACIGATQIESAKRGELQKIFDVIPGKISIITGWIVLAFLGITGVSWGAFVARLVAQFLSTLFPVLLGLKVVEDDPPASNTKRH